MTQTRVGAVILAAGKGTRMHSDLPKVLQQLLGEPMLWYVFKALGELFGRDIWTVIGHKAELVQKTFEGLNLCDKWVLQEQQLGTGHALQMAWNDVINAGIEQLVVINGDTPLVTAESIQGLLDHAKEEQSPLSFISLTLSDPASFGRVVRDENSQGSVRAIVEAKDYDPDVYGPEPNEINAGIYCIDVKAISPLLDKLQNNNKSGEYYITDLVGFAVDAGMKVTAFDCGDDPMLLGVNSPVELVKSEELIRARIVDSFLNAGVLIRQGASVRIGPRVTIEPGAAIQGPVEIYGDTTLAAGVTVDSHCWLKNMRIGRDAAIHPFSHLENAVVGNKCNVGPYARLRPMAEMQEGARVGNFVEMKKSTLGKGAKASHLTYLGDAQIGDHVNIGAGTITCNYDGQNKFTTTVQDGAFIGSNSALVAPVTIGKGALVGAGSVITQDVADEMLALGRARQISIPRRDKS